MAFLYERFATWRALVQATRDPRKLAVITVITTATFGGAAYAMQRVTDRAAAANEEVVRGRLNKDREATRYAAHSKRALEVVLSQAQGKPSPEHQHPMKMPAVHWHPGALARSGDNVTKAGKSKELPTTNQTEATGKDEK